MDVHIPRAITTGLRLRGIDVLTAQDDSTTLLDDYSLLKRASSLGRILVTFDHDFLGIVNELQEKMESFSGLVFCNYSEMNIGECINNLELLAKIYIPSEMENRIEFLPV